MNEKKRYHVLDLKIIIIKSKKTKELAMKLNREN